MKKDMSVGEIGYLANNLVEIWLAELFFCFLPHEPTGGEKGSSESESQISQRLYNWQDTISPQMIQSTSEISNKIHTTTFFFGGASTEPKTNPCSL